MKPRQVLECSHFEWITISEKIFNTCETQKKPQIEATDRQLLLIQFFINFFERWEENVPTETVTSLTNFGAINVFFVVSFSLESPHRSHPKNISLTSTHNKVEGTTEAAAARTPPVTAEASSTKTDTGQRRFAARNPVEEVKKGTRSGGSYEAQKGSFYL